MQQENIFDVAGADSFDLQVLEQSHRQPVLVDFWADWCAPCKALMPLLEKITADYQGELLLAKVNCDVEHEIVARFGVRSLPTVVLFKDGQPVDGFAGAQTEADIRQMLDKHLPPPTADAISPLEQARELFAGGEITRAQQLLQQLLAEDNSDAAALILYARCLLENNELDDAEQVLEAVRSDEHKQELAAAKARLTFLRQANDLPDAADLKSRIAQNPADHEAVYQLAIRQLAQGQYEPALKALLELFVAAPEQDDDAAKRSMLQVFDLLGNEDELVRQYRRRLYQALY